MRLVILTGEGEEHRYFTSQVAAAFPSEVLAVVVSRKPQPSPLARARSYMRRYTFRQILSRVVAKGYAKFTRSDERRRATMRRFFSDGVAGDHLPAEALLRVVPGHNSAQCAALLRDLRPDVIAVFGTAMIKPVVMALASKAAINMHTGISPYYRGSDTIFWPLYHEEPEMVGVTIHLLDPGIDSGPIIATARPKVDANDDENILFCKAIIAGSRLYVDAIRSAAAGELRSSPQQLHVGREYRFVDRTVAAEWRVKKLLAGGLLHRYTASGGTHVPSKAVDSSLAGTSES